MILIVFFMIFVICLFLKLFNINEFLIGNIFFILSTILMIFVIFEKKDNKNIKMVLLFSLCLRIILLIIDLNYFRLPHAGADDDYFYNTAINISNNYSLLSVNMYGGVYPKILSLIFLVLGKSRLGVQFINVIFSMFFLFIMNDNLKLINISDKFRFKIMLLLSFFPNGLFLGSILRREIIISFLLSISINFIIKWFSSHNNKYIIISFFFSFLASLFHSAMLVIPVVILIYCFLYNFTSKKISFKGINFVKSFILTLFVLFFLIFFIKNFQNKFVNINSMEDIYSEMTNTRGNSVYLSNLVINNFYQLILFTPIKTIYFLFSPMLWDIRGISDLITIFLDSFLYLFLLLKILKLKSKSISKMFFSSFLLLSILFAMGTFTSGTAVRHRYNTLPLLIMSYACSFSEKEKEKLTL